MEQGTLPWQLQCVGPACIANHGDPEDLSTTRPYGKMEMAERIGGRLHA
jgi:hypothetical protein